MSKKFKLVALTLACVVTLGAGAINAFASAKTSTFVEDSFNDHTFEGSTNSETWVTTLSDSANPSIRQSGAENPALQFVQNESGGEKVQLGTTNKIENIEYVSFSLNMSESIKGTDKWFGVHFAPALDTTVAYGANHYRSPIMINPRYAYAQGASATSAVWDNLFPDVIEEFGSITGTWVSFKLVPTSSSTIEVYIALRAENPEETEYPALPAMTVNGFRSDAVTGTDYKNAYIMFGSEGRGHGSLIDDIKIVGSNITIEETFTNVMMSEEIQAYPTHLMGTSFKVMDNNTLEIVNAKAGDRILTHAKIAEETSIAEGILIFEASFNIKMSKTSTDEVAFVFGLDGSTADPSQDSYAYVIGKDYGRVIKHVGGEVVYESQIENALIQVASKKGATINIKVYKDGAVEVYEDGKFKANLPNAETYMGNMGFATFSNTTGTVNIDAVIIKKTSYYVPVTKSVTHNFENDYFGNEGFEDFVAYSSSGKICVDNGKLLYDHCADDSFFGSAHQYDSYIMDYQLCSIDVSAGKTKSLNWIGLDIGRPSLNATDYGLNVMYAVVIVPEVGMEKTSSWLYFNDKSPVDQTTVKVIHHKDIPASLFRDIQYDNETRTEEQIKAGDAVCFRWVSDAANENMKLYLKKASESEFTLYVEITGINASGYQALRCTGWTTFKLDNFSMSNTSPIYEIADNEAPEKETVIKEEIIYTKPDVDVNWDEEIRLNGEVKGDGSASQSGGCKGSVAGGAGMTALALIGACLLRKKEH